MPRTQRPDLAAVEVFSDTTTPNPYLSAMIFPPLSKAGKAGTLYYVGVDADVAAQTGRTLGAAPTTTTLANTSTTFATAEAIKRVNIPDDELALMGGLQRGQEKAARIGKRSIMRAKEDALVALLNSGAGATADILASLRQAIDVGLDAIQRVSGESVLACGWTTYRRMTRYTEITNALLRTGIAGQDPRDVRNVDPVTLATVLGVSEIMVGDDDHWTAGTAYLLKRPNANVEPDEVPQIGRCVQYLPDGEQPFLMESYFDETRIAETVDCRSWYINKVLNGSGIYELTGIDEGNAVVTTA
jgi:hypothetical protein